MNLKGFDWRSTMNLEVLELTEHRPLERVGLKAAKSLLRGSD
jgi:hypothetical protein